MFVVVGIKPEFCMDGDTFTPNEKFDTKFKLIQFTDIQEIILDKLEKELPETLLHPDQTFSLIRKRQTLEQILQNEI